MRFLFPLVVLAGGAVCAQDQTVQPRWQDRFWLSGQVNLIDQWHPDFHSPYEGPNSLSARSQNALSRVMTLYTGVRLAGSTELLFDVESAGGKGIGDALGLAGFTNLDVVRNPTLGSKPYVARVMIHQTFAFTDEAEPAPRTPFSLSPRLPVRRLEIRAGRFSVADFFDVNSVGSDSHLQFMNWTIDNNGGYDYAADTRGYTYGILTEYWDRNYTIRFGETLMPKVANGLELDWNIARARAENFEWELRHHVVPNRAGTVRLLSYVNHGNMGSYRDAIHAFQQGSEAQSDVIATRQQGRIKYGFGFNAEQELTGDLRVFGRFGWNEGHNESFAYTEVNQSFAAGGDLRGSRWHRKDDKIGVAYVWNAISGDHRAYLQYGGLGFLLGDGRLNYGRERILESYYTLTLGLGFALSPGVQYVANPGYNRDRGPVVVPTLRLHFDANTPFSRVHN